MWIKRENCQSVNTDMVQSISKGSSGARFYIYFMPVRNQSSAIEYSFKNQEERDEYFNLVMGGLGANDFEKEMKLNKLI
jgi:hypothetical protein